jgi:KUP system potassium uptake protein
MKHIKERLDSSQKRMAALTLAALGVVYGDIGTSPLYAFKEVFVSQSQLGVTFDSVAGVLSLFVWSLVFVVALKYVVLIMRADNKGEGGIIALTTLAMHGLKERSVLRRILVVLGLCGAAFFYGDGTTQLWFLILYCIALYIINRFIDKYLL